MKIKRYGKVFIHIKEFIPGTKDYNEELEWLIEKYFYEIKGKERINTYED